MSNLGRGKSIKIEFAQGSTKKKYKCIGQQCNRGGPGLKDTAKVDPKSWNVLRSLVCATDDVVKAWGDTADIGGLRKAQEVSGYSGMVLRGNHESETSTSMGAVAVGCNVVLNSHTDEDFFYSYVTTHVNTTHYEEDMPVVQYFTFPTLGYAVALRPGDVLSFNALAYHSVSTKSHAGEGTDVYCASVYLKSRLVGGNDNGNK